MLHSLPLRLLLHPPWRLVLHHHPNLSLSLNPSPRLHHLLQCVVSQFFDLCLLQKEHSPRPRRHHHHHRPLFPRWRHLVCKSLNRSSSRPLPLHPRPRRLLPLQVPRGKARDCARSSDMSTRYYTLVNFPLRWSIENISQATEENEMDLVEDELIEEIEQMDEGWWSGVGRNGTKSGLFPGGSKSEVLSNRLNISPTSQLRRANRASG